LFARKYKQENSTANVFNKSDAFLNEMVILIQPSKNADERRSLASASVLLRVEETLQRQKHGVADFAFILRVPQHDTRFCRSLIQGDHISSPSFFS
jgi:hypothetical protein